MSAAVSLTMMPGVGLRMLELLQQGRDSREQCLADLRTVARQCNLPGLHWQMDDRWGVTGTARGSDKRVEAAVTQWADAFAAEAEIRYPELRMGPRGEFVVAGFAVAQLRLPGLDVTVAGRLSGRGGTR